MADPEDELERLLEAYLDPPVEVNAALVGVRIHWIEGDPDIGALHMEKHLVTKDEVEQVLMEVPPMVRAKRHREHADRTVFLGATRWDRWLFVCCIEREELDGTRVLVPLTAFEPEDPEDYWQRS